MDPIRLRDEFPVLSRLAYLNAGTDGPVPGRAIAAAQAELEREAEEGRWQAHFERRSELATALRGAYAQLLGCDARDVALTTSATESISIAVAGLELDRGDEILTSEDEHPGLLGSLQAARDLRGVSIRMAPLVELASAVGPRTRLVACSHVSWTTGARAPAALAELDVPVLLDGAQGAGAVPVDVSALGCDLYAGAGQKWLCGPDGTGLLYVAPPMHERLAATRRGYTAFAAPDEGLDAPLHPDARRYDAPALPAEGLAFAITALDVLAATGWDAVHARARSLAEAFVEPLVERGRMVAARDGSTLVSFTSDDPAGERARLAAAGVVVRDVPGRPWLRASVGAWNDESDLDRLLAALD